MHGKINLANLKKVFYKNLNNTKALKKNGISTCIVFQYGVIIYVY